MERWVRRWFSLLLCLLFAAAAGAGGKSAPLLGPDEFGLNFGAGKRSANVYSRILTSEVSGARIRIGAQVSPGLFGASVEGRSEGGFGFVTLQRPFRTDAVLGGFDAQLIAQAKSSEISPGAFMGMERSVRNPQGEVTDFVFIGVTPNPGISGLTAFR